MNPDDLTAQQNLRETASEDDRMEAPLPESYEGAAELTPLTGRDTEVALLRDRWEQAQEGMGQIDVA
jgi:hypothetical protein